MRKAFTVVAALALVVGSAYFFLFNRVVSEPAAPPEVEAPSEDVTISPAAAGARYEVVSGESSGRYLVREELARISLPVDAIGVTTALTGQVGFDSSGAVAEGSRIVADLTSLASDESRRDQYVRSNILHTSRYPNAVFAPKEVRGIPHPVPTEGTVDVVIVGELTIRDVTREVVWEGSATFSPDGFVISAATTITFEEFGLSKPRVAVVLSVDDPIRLEANIKFRSV